MSKPVLSGRLQRLGAAAVSGLTLFASTAALALPMASEGSFMAMVDLHSAGERDAAVNYAVTGRDALGVMATRWHEPVLHAGIHARKHERESVGLTYTRLVHRWNLPHAQANLWLLGDAGRLRRAGGHGQTASDSGYAAVEFMGDYETTRVYLGGSFRALRGEDSLRHDVARVRTGFSFWEAEYEGIQPWLLMEAKRTRYSAGAMPEGTVLTPMLRFIHRRWFIEFGVNRNGGMFNLMFNY
jgi:hypothetical protein